MKFNAFLPFVVEIGALWWNLRLFCGNWCSFVYNGFFCEEIKLLCREIWLSRAN